VSAPIKLSIITVNLNNAAGLSKTLESVASQTFTNYEHIIIDGGSTDGSVDIIKDYERKYNGVPGHLYWVSEPDKGIYNAMNKGIKVASGEYLEFLNSGDYYFSKHSIMFFNQDLNFDLVFGDDIVEEKDGRRTTIERPDKITINHLLTKTMSHSASFFKNELFVKFGLYNESYKIAADYEFFLKIFYNGISYLHLNNAITIFETGGISGNPAYDQLRIIEKEAAIKAILPDFIYADIVAWAEYKRSTELLLKSRILKASLLIRTVFLKAKTILKKNK